MDNSTPNTEWDGGDDGVAVAAPLPVTSAPQAAPVAVADEPLPSDYKSLMALHQQLYRSIPLEKSEAARAKLNKRHTLVRRRLAEMQNGPAAPSIGASENA